MPPPSSFSDTEPTTQNTIILLCLSEAIENWPIQLLGDDFDSTSEDDEIEELQNEPLPEAENTNKSTPYKGQIFNSDETAYNFYCLFAKRCGFSVRRGHSYKHMKNNIEDIYKREYICHRAGIAKQKKIDEVERQRKRKSSRCKCSAKLFITKRTIGFDECWVVTYFSNSHNHVLLDDKEVRFLPAYRDISINDQSRILLLSKAGCSVNIIMRVLELEKGIEAGHLPFLEKDIRNFLQSQGNVGKENDASEVLKLCKSLKDMDDAFQYDFTMDESNKLENIIWVFGDSIRAYEVFGDVVVFDTTYRINRYDMPLGLWVGVDNHGNSIFFGCVLLRNEKIPSFTWALQSFLHFVKGKYPQTILTDQDHALKEAISTELPNTKHAFCIWHIVSKFPNWFSFSLGPNYEDFKSEFYRLYNLECTSDFERQWKLMVDNLDLSEDQHIVSLYSHRHFWALAYLKEYFFAGMTTTGRSESINSYIKKFLDVKTSLVDFVNQVGVAVNIRNQAGEVARMHQKYHNLQIITSFPIEEHAANILTPYAFELLQHEMELSSKYAATKTDNDSYIVRHHTKHDGGRLVRLIQEKESIHCSCKEFEFAGILCRHAIRVLLKNDYFCIPEKYLPSRWRRESSLIPQSSHIINCTDNSSNEFRSLVQCLEVETLKTKDRVEVATKELERVIELVKGMSEVPEQTIDLEHRVRDDNDYDVENPITSKTKGRPKGSRPKGGVEVAKKTRRCHFPNCGGTNHDSRNCPNKRKKATLLTSQSPNK
ncbi:hypothetical protein OROGR_010686 [Orobanche gracilis]